MASSYVKTAKDLAWDKERSKLKSDIFHQRTHITELRAEVENLNLALKEKQEEIDNLNSTIEQLNKILQLSPDDLKLLLDQERNRVRSTEVLSGLSKLASGYIGF